MEANSSGRVEDLTGILTIVSNFKDRMFCENT